MRSFSIEWLPEALEEKKGILDFLEGKSVIAALAIDDHMERQVGQLAEFPYIGRNGRIPDSFELVISRTPYLVAYRIDGDQVQILHVFHERQNWPPKH